MLDQDIARDLTDRYQAFPNSDDFISRADLDAIYATFRHRFGPETLASLDGKALLETMHDHGNKDSLVYWLEFKDDDEFPACFGSIAGGSAFKFGIYRRAETGDWRTGNATHPVDLTVDEAVERARQHRNQLLSGLRALDQLPENAGDAAYRALQDTMDKVAPDVSRLAWGHKYFSMLAPSKLDDYHAENHQRFHLIKLLQTPPEGKGRYLCAARYVAIARELGMPLNHLTSLLNQRNGGPYRYWRIETRLGERDSIWPQMRDGSFAAIGWAQLGDLSSIESNGKSKERLRELLHLGYADTPSVLGRKTQEIFSFVTAIRERDLVLASDGGRTLGIGRVIGGYKHVSGEAAPHRRPVEWLNLDEWELPVAEGLQTTVSRIRNTPENLVAIERKILAPLVKAPKTVLPQGPLHLSGVPARIQAVLGRKRNVILYGPPGTGKTYWARKTALDLAADAAFGSSFDGLNERQKADVDGDRGLVRLCAFHPAYGYEDFLEGFRPVAHDGQLAFELQDGIFKLLCDDARKKPAQSFFLIVDEINRGDIPRVFGELLTVLERDKRGQSILLSLSGRLFSVPDNVYLIGTMNTADRSIALLDTALRRRFGFVELMPDSGSLGKTVVGGVPLGLWLDALNSRVREHTGRDARNLQVGHAYLLENGKPVSDFGRFARILQDDILPLLQEYCYEDFQSLEKILGAGLIDRTGQLIRHELFDPSRRDDLVAALLAPAPGIATSSVAVEAAPDGIGGDEDDGASGDEPPTS